MSKDAVANLTFTTDDLAAMDRDLRFFPANTTSPRVLTRDEIDHYNQFGYSMGHRVFDEEEIGRIRALFDGWLAEALEDGRDSYSIFTAHKRYPEAYDLICHPRIVDYVADILGENVTGWGMHFFCKMPHDGKRVSWHQDISYWPLSKSKTCTIWLAIDDADTENGCMRFIPRSHLHGHIPFSESDNAEGNVLNQTVHDAEQYGDDPVDVLLKAGEMSLHSDLLLHGSEANNSDRRRCGVTMRYCSNDVEAYHPDWSAKGVVVRGTDPRGHWGNPARP